MTGDLLYPIGKAVKAHGLKGHLKIIPYGETLSSLAVGEKVTARMPDGSVHALTISDLRPHQKAFLFLSSELTSVEQASNLVGAELCVPESRLPATVADEFYWYQLIGLEVVSSQGQKLGTIEEIIETGSNDVYVVRQGDEETLVPATHEVVQEVNLRKGRMTVELPGTL